MTLKQIKMREKRKRYRKRKAAKKRDAKQYALPGGMKDFRNRTGNI